ncbi:MAG: translation initiation factor IF-2 [Candidatus Yanofskybacteria bacterium RIFCSPHIGHO2_02_FULL_44_12b]|uniref:Translation initiation factor IF-2 n=2 Tax=Candidatus Yanofskyibacteriota TaxID=1752733 RepID=A0A1F8GM64_9BACT|nr:MAG: Translation initiation factor IF-2 [Candidatus Yanofskybacteria bacterium GW2011_GWA2_44_9]OGN05482.1 MAG: translation initiation factor IF-2 [Candidatus Yanofskybacteria bacterium RIFCSPHIGHO2_01_FULL_44_24]OGN15035.1 MAG: translation initiation factor IF-2 [Candidatus Yanofskybacteria bacterium RIFCSPHIGHO2_02_FULL_44_12b]OGN26502.1 MAG: translation initiation factor IF-2 [Candidatus Yanofskybacteria bacterium RIFCSPLOWO2_01_FULL_44_22]
MTDKSQNSNVKIRPPIVVILGHVDHGKTKLLDTIRSTKVAEGESGGITQHIGAYQTEVNGKKITFLDTPGHEAFTAIRSRGVKVADIAVLVIAADESVKPQTKEAIRIIKEEKIPLVVAVNKIDKEGANIERVKQDLAAEDILVEDWGGKVPLVQISAKQNKNIDDLLDMILLIADLEALEEDLSGPAEGVIIESNLDKRRGYVATAIVLKGILKIGNWVAIGTSVGKVKSMENFLGKPVFESVPSEPVLITGWSSAPDIGKKFITTESKEEALKISAANVNLDPLFVFLKGEKENPEDPKKKILNLVIKSDVSSSLEAIDTSLKAIKSDEVEFRVITYDIGNINEADIKTAIGAKAEVIGFRVGVDESVKKMAEREGVKIASFDIIYQLIEFVRKEMAGLLDPEIKKIPLGKLKILAVFKKDPKWQIVGGKVVSGKIMRGAMADALRGNVAIGSGKISQLQHNKEDTQEVKEGFECGIRFDTAGKEFKEIKVGDILDVYEEEKLARSL